MTVTGSHSNFHFQVSATINVYGVYIEGERSQISQSSTVFVPVDRKSINFIIILVLMLCCP